MRWLEQQGLIALPAQQAPSPPRDAVPVTFQQHIEMAMGEPDSQSGDDSIAQ
jgi:hypothetical protein